MKTPQELENKALIRSHNPVTSVDEVTQEKQTRVAPLQEEYLHDLDKVSTSLTASPYYGSHHLTGNGFGVQ